MQSSVLRSAWALQHARGYLPTALQQAAALLERVPAPEDAVATSTQLAVRPCCQAAAPPASSSADPADGKPLSAMRGWGRCYASSASAAPLSSSSSSSGARPTGAYAIEIAVQGFEKRYVDMACNTIDDLLMLAFAPKGFAALPVGAPSADDAPVNITFGSISRRDVRLPWRRTRFTLLRSPHIDKQGMEQFERREYKTVLNAATNSDEELRRLLEAMKIYQFTGVQIRIDVTSAQRVELPKDLRQVLSRTGPAAAPAAGSDAAESGPGTVLGAPAVTLPAPRSAEALFQQELSAVLRVLRPLVWTGLQGRRRALDAVPEFASWQQQQQQRQRAGRAPTPVASALLGDESYDAGGGDGHAYGQLLRQRLRQQMNLMREQLTPEADAPTQQQQPATAAAAYGLDPSVAAELLARIDAELLNAHEAALQGAPPPSESPPSGALEEPAAPGAPGGTAATPPPPLLDASKMSPAEYAYAVLKYVQYVDALYEASGAEAARRASDAALQLSAPGLALRLLQLWCAATSAEFKQHLGLPPAEVEKRILEEQLRREEMAKAAAALSKTGREAQQAAAQGQAPGGTAARSGSAPPSGSGATGAPQAGPGQGPGQAPSQGQGQSGPGRPRGRGQQGWRDVPGGQDGGDSSRGRQQPRRGPGP